MFSIIIGCLSNLLTFIHNLIVILYMYVFIWCWADAEICFKPIRYQAFQWLLIYQFVTYRNISLGFHQLFDLFHSNYFNYVILFVCSLTISSSLLITYCIKTTRNNLKSKKRVHHQIIQIIQFFTTIAWLKHQNISLQMLSRIANWKYKRELLILLYLNFVLFKIPTKIK